MTAIPYGHQWVDEEDIEEVVKVLRSYFLTQGPKVREFEDALRRYCGARYAVAVSSGTAALHLACRAAGVTDGHEAITSPITFLASANCIRYCGGKPVFADVRPDTVTIDPEAVKKKVSDRTRAIIPVHYAGHPCDLEAIAEIAEKSRALVIEDAAHALGAEYRDERIGSGRYSDMTTFSFHPVKQITTGEGGAVLTGRADLYEQLLMLRDHGITKNADRFANPHGLYRRGCDWYHEMHSLGYNYRLTDLQSALGRSQLGKMETFLRRRREIAARYGRAFAGQRYFHPPREKEGARSSWHLYPIRLRDRYARHRAGIFRYLRERGIGVQVHYIPVYLQPYYAGLGYTRGVCPNAESFYEAAISLPLYPGMRDDEVDTVIEAVLKACALPGEK